jgi:protein-S-isoprenylcysteine O-methyltransferase Ste14
LWHVVVTLVVGGSLFLAGLPYLLVAAGRWLDDQIGLSQFGAGLPTRVAGVVLVIVGGAFAFWSVLAEVSIGRGTPVPMIPTQRLVVVPPFTYCRNPMILGTATAYLGLGVSIGSVSAIVLALLFAGLLLLYVKVFEERELEARFGAPYLQYKRTTPFLIPRLPPRSANG